MIEGAAQTFAADSATGSLPTAVDDLVPTYIKTTPACRLAVLPTRSTAAVRLPLAPVAARHTVTSRPTRVRSKSSSAGPAVTLPALLQF